MNNPPNRTKRIAFMISDATDALIGFGLLPFEVSQYGFKNWHVILLGALLFILGVWIFAYNL